MRRFTKYTLFAAILFFRITTIDAYACSCAEIRPPCEAYWEASAVFVGVVTGDSSISVKDGQYQFQAFYESVILLDDISVCSPPLANRTIY